MRPGLLYIGNRLSRHGSTATAIEILGPLLEREGFPVHYASSKKNKLLRFADMLAAVWRFGRSSDYVLIDTYSTQNFWYAVFVARLCRILGLRYIPILHGGNLPRRLASDKSACKKLFGGAYLNVAPSPYLGKAFTEAGFSVMCIPNPFDAGKFPFRPRASFSPKLLWVRSLAPIYNPMMALEALKILSVKHPDAKLCMVGPDRGLQPELDDFARRNGLNVRFAGKLSQAQWAALSREYDIFLNTSTTDNSPFSLIEAASLGLAIVSTDVGGIPYFFENGKQAALVPSGDSRCMADVVSGLVSDSGKTTAMVAAARGTALRSDWPEVRAKWLEILR